MEPPRPRVVMSPLSDGSCPETGRNRDLWPRRTHSCDRGRTSTGAPNRAAPSVIEMPTRTGEGLRLSAQVVNGHRQDGGQCVHRRSAACPAREGTTLLVTSARLESSNSSAIVAHSGHHDDHIVTCLLSVHDRGGQHTLRIGYGTPKPDDPGS